MKKKRIYLASPYTHDDREIRIARFESAKNACAKLIRNGNLVFSPIVHSHLLAEYNLPVEFKFWKDWCLSFIRYWATDFYILDIDGWKTSKGIAAERHEAAIRKIPVLLLDPALAHFM